MRVSRPLKPKTQLVIIGMVIVIGIMLIIYYIIPIISDVKPQFITENVSIATATGGICQANTNDAVVENVSIATATGGICQANTNDAVVPLKIIDGCSLPEGAKVTIRYQQGLPFATIVSP